MIRKNFYDYIRNNLLNGHLSQGQVNGMEAVLNEWDHQKLTDDRWLAYMLATDFHETAHTMQPIEEYGKGYGHAYGNTNIKTGKAYYGRGLVQLTWDYNYEKMGKRLNIDLLHQPELALSMPVAVKIMFDGMINGIFTGKKLSTYFDAAHSDWYNARRIINGVDRAQLISGYGQKFWNALNFAAEVA